MPSGESMKSNHPLDGLFDARSVAVVGASNVPGKWGFGILSRLLSDGGRDVYPVNRKQSEVLGVKAYPSLREIPAPVDMAVIATGAELVPPTMEECAQKRVGGALIISGGFSETGEEGAKLERQVVDIARRGGTRFIGPNCMGHFDAHSNFYTIPFKMRVRKGPATIITQSGNMGIAVIANGWEAGLGFSKYINTGNEADVHLEEFMEYLAQDDNTQVILGYIEGLREAKRFLQLAREITQKKPMIVLKSGRSAEGSRAARSHSAALSGSDSAAAAAFKQSGVIRVDEISDLVDTGLAFAAQPLPRGRRVGVISMGGGLGVISTDSLRRHGLEMARFSARTIDKLDSLMSTRWSRGNPIDPGGDPVIYPCIWPLLEDDNVDAVMVVGGIGMVGGLAGLMSIPDMAKGAYDRLMAESERQEVDDLDRLLELMKRHRKPVLLSRMVSGSIVKGKVSEKLLESSIYPYPSPERAARALARLVEYSEHFGVSRR